MSSNQTCIAKYSSSEDSNGSYLIYIGKSTIEGRLALFPTLVDRLPYGLCVAPEFNKWGELSELLSGNTHCFKLEDLAAAVDRGLISNKAIPIAMEMLL